MQKPMTEEQITITLAQAHANVMAVVEVTSEQRIVDVAATREFRSVFEAGQRDGRALALEGAQELMGAMVANSQEVQFGRSMLAVMAWCALVPGRSFSGLTDTASQVMAGNEADKFSDDGDSRWFHYEYGASAGEALSKLATWCNEHTANTRRDTLPAAAPASEDVAF